MVPVVTERKYNIHHYEVDMRAKVLMTSIVNYLSDISIYQSEVLGIGIEYLKESNLGWVLYKWDIDIDSYANYNETITVRTSAYSFRKFYAYRIFEILNSDGEKIGYAKSVWLLINTNKRKPVKITDDLYKAYGIDYENNKPLEIQEIKPVYKIDTNRRFDVRYSDIDTNKHVNNAKYISWALETVPKDVVLDYSIKNIKVTYEKETTYGETIKVCTQVNKNVDNVICYHKIVDENEKELTILETVWKKVKK